MNILPTPTPGHTPTPTRTHTKEKNTNHTITVPVASSVDALRLIDSQTYDTIERLDLAPDYKGFSITSMTFENDSVPYYVVGSVQALQEDKEPSGGRIQVFCVEEGRLRLVAEKDTKAAVWSVQAFQV